MDQAELEVNDEAADHPDDNPMAANDGNQVEALDVHEGTPYPYDDNEE